MSTAKTTHETPPAKGARPLMPVENTTDATRGEPLAQRAQTRRAELAQALEALPADETRARGDISAALSAIDGMLTGDVAHLADSTAAEISRWLEGSKHLAEITGKPRKGH